jgi:hypothetical protein
MSEKIATQESGFLLVFYQNRVNKSIINKKDMKKILIGLDCRLINGNFRLSAQNVRNSEKKWRKNRGIAPRNCFFPLSF